MSNPERMLNDLEKRAEDATPHPPPYQIPGRTYDLTTICLLITGQEGKTKRLLVNENKATHLELLQDLNGPLPRTQFYGPLATYKGRIIMEITTPACPATTMAEYVKSAIYGTIIKISLDNVADFYAAGKILRDKGTLLKKIEREFYEKYSNDVRFLKFYIKYSDAFHPLIRGMMIEAETARKPRREEIMQEFKWIDGEMIIGTINTCGGGTIKTNSRILAKLVKYQRQSFHNSRLITSLLFKIRVDRLGKMGLVQLLLKWGERINQVDRRGLWKRFAQ